MTVSAACVYRTGGDFGPEHPVALYYNLMKYNDHLVDEFVCLTNSYTARRQFDGVNKARVVQLEHDTPGWWSKLELFRPDVFAHGQRVVYFDLDMIPTGDLAALFDPDEHRFLATRGPRFGNLASGVMAWTHGHHGRTVMPVYTDDPVGIRRRYDGRRFRGSAGRHGDQGFVADRLDSEGTDWLAADDVQPGIVRYRWDTRLEHYRGTASVPDDVRLVILSGRSMRPDLFWPELWWPRDDEEDGDDG